MTASQFLTLNLEYQKSLYNENGQTVLNWHTAVSRLTVSYLAGMCVCFTEEFLMYLIRSTTSVPFQSHTEYRV